MNVRRWLSKCSCKMWNNTLRKSPSWQYSIASRVLELATLWTMSSGTSNVCTMFGWLNVRIISHSFAHKDAFFSSSPAFMFFIARHSPEPLTHKQQSSYTYIDHVINWQQQLDTNYALFSHHHNNTTCAKNMSMLSKVRPVSAIPWKISSFNILSYFFHYSFQCDPRSCCFECVSSASVSAFHQARQQYRPFVPLNVHLFFDFPLNKNKTDCFYVSKINQVWVCERIIFCLYL